MPRIVIFGAGELAEVVFDHLRTDPDCEVAAFTVDGAYCASPSLLGLPLVPFEEVERSYPPEAVEMFVAVGYQRMNAVRREKCEEARARGYRLTTWVHPTSSVPDSVRLGENCFLMEHNVLQPHVCLGDGVIMNVANVVGHHGEVGDYAFFSSHGVIGGRTRIGPGSFVGPNVFLRDGLEIGAESLIGAGAVVMANAPAKSVFAVPSTKPRSVTSDRLRRI